MTVYTVMMSGAVTAIPIKCIPGTSVTTAARSYLIGFVITVTCVTHVSHMCHTCCVTCVTHVVTHVTV